MLQVRRCLQLVGGIIIAQGRFDAGLKTVCLAGQCTSRSSRSEADPSLRGFVYLCLVALLLAAGQKSSAVAGGIVMEEGGSSSSHVAVPMMLLSS